MRVDKDSGDLLSIAQIEVLPGVTSIAGLVNPVAGGEIRTPQAFPTAHVNNFRIGRRNGKRSHRTDGLIVEDRVPGASVVGGLPHSAVVWSHIENVGLSWHAADRNPAAGTKWSDQSPMQFLKQFAIKLLGETECDKREYQ